MGTVIHARRNRKDTSILLAVCSPRDRFLREYVSMNNREEEEH
jgi:hypothetical protein